MFFSVFSMGQAGKQQTKNSPFVRLLFPYFQSALRFSLCGWYCYVADDSLYAT
jgi:hypothetical protein